MAEKTTSIITLKPHDSGTAPLSLNGREFRLKLGKKVDVPDVFLPLLDDSNIEYELVGAKAAAEGAEGATGVSGEPAPEAAKAKAPRRRKAKGAKKAAASLAGASGKSAEPPRGMTTTKALGRDKVSGKTA